jgi:hypothetical protein
MKKCKWKGVNHHRTRDAVTFSDGAAEQTAVAIFRRGHNATCRCMAEEGCAPENCDALYITDEGGERLATLQGASLRARQLQNGSIAVYRASVTTGDAAIDRAVVQIRTRLAEINQRNAEFWARRTEEEQ